MVGLVEVSIDGGLEVDDRSEHAAFQAPLGEDREEGLEHEVGVTWKVKRRLWAA